jgi:hypothetical protein
LPTASTFSLRLADRNYEEQMPSLKEPAQAVAEIDYTVESANRMAEELRAIPAKDPAKRKLDKQGMVSLLAGELIALQKRGYTIEEVAEGLRGRGLTITTPTLKNYLQRAKSKTEKRARSRCPTAPNRSGSGTSKAGTSETSNSPLPATAQAQPGAKQAASTPEAGAAPEGTAVRSGKGAFLVKDKDSY